MNLSDLLEDSNKDLVIIYPGRFHPFHIGHGKVYKYLKQKYSNAKVFISTSGKVDGDRSPFTFEEKRKMMILAGVSSSDIVQTKSPYQSIEIMERFDKDKTVVVFAVSEKDMAEDPRFDFSNGLKLKKNGEPAYLQKWNGLEDSETFGTRGYIATTPTFKFKVLGQEINSASQIRNMIAKSDDTKLTQMLQDLYNITDVPQDIIDLFKKKVGNKETMNENWDEHSFSKFLKENVIEDNTMKTGILTTITEGKSPHKKGTKKYKAHMAAMHAESFDEEFDAKVEQVVESKLKNVAADIKDYVDDHKEHFDAYPMDVEVNGKVYDFDYYWKILDLVYPDSYDNQYAVESLSDGVAWAEKQLGRETTNEEKEELKEFWPAVAAAATRIPPNTYATAATAVGAAASKAGKWIKRKLKNSVDHNIKEDYANDQHEKLEYIHHVIQETGEDGHNDELMIQQALEYVDDIKVRDEEDEMKLSYVSKALSASVDEDRYFDQKMADQALEYVEDIREQHFNADGSTKSESIKELSISDVEKATKKAKKRQEKEREDTGKSSVSTADLAARLEVKEANEDSIDAIYSNDGKTITISDYQPEGMANAHKKFNLRKQIHRGENGKLITSPWGGYKVSFHGDAEDVKAYAKNHLGESMKEAIVNEDHDIKLLKAVARQMASDAQKGDYTAIDELLQDVSEEELKAFLSDHRSPDEVEYFKRVNGESIEEAQVLAHGGKGQYKAVSDGGVVRIMHKGKEIASGDFDSGADGWFVSREDDKGQKFFSNAQDMVDFFAEQKVNEWVQDSPEKGFSGQERNFIQELCLRMDGVSKSPEGLKWMGKSETWDEGNVLSDKGKLTTVMLWAKKNIDDLYDKMGSKFKVYSDGNDKGDSGRGQSDGNQIMQNIIKKIGTVNEDWEDVTPKGYGPDDYDEKDVAPEDHGGDLKKMQDTYKYNEDRNNHSENILMLAQAFGDRGEIRAVEGLLKIIKRQGYTTPEQSDMMYKAIHKKYYSQLFPAENEGNKFGGELEKAKIDGRKSFDVDGKTYKVKEALSRLIDNQKI